jgi:large subunit ribosomal protein L3
MGPGILGKKIGMTQVYRPNGEVVPVTLVKAGPCVVVQRKTPTVDGYDAIQLGLVEFAKASRTTKPAAGHLKKAGADGVRFVREMKLNGGAGDLKAGDRILVDQFKPADKVDVIGVSKGKGFGGLVKRHHSAAVLPRTDRCFTGRRVRSARPAFRRASSPAHAWPGNWATSG